MFNITLTTESAIVLRDALRIYKERWAGGDAYEQELIIFLETEFTKIVLESYMDAWHEVTGNGVPQFSMEDTMPNVEVRQRVREQAKAIKEQKLVYRGVAYLKSR